MNLSHPNNVSVVVGLHKNIKDVTFDYLWQKANNDGSVSGKWFAGTAGTDT
jgi:hypothetical protein